MNSDHGIELNEKHRAEDRPILSGSGFSRNDFCRTSVKNRSIDTEKILTSQELPQRNGSRSKTAYCKLVSVSLVASDTNPFPCGEPYSRRVWFAIFFGSILSIGSIL